MLKDRQIKIKYLYNAEYIKNIDELLRYVDPDVVTLEPLTPYNKKNSKQLWMGNKIDSIDYTEVDRYFSEFYKKIAETFGIEGMNTSLYQKEDYLNDIYNTMDDKFKDLDILMINATPQSGQLKFDKEKFDEAAKKLSAKFKIATTSPADDSIPCTFTHGLMLQDIGAISTHAKYIVCVNSGPMVPCFNELTKNNVKRVIMFDKYNMRFKELPVLRFNSDYNVRDIEKNLI